MALARILVTGFGPFLDVQDNPSGRLARALEDDPPPGAGVTASVLPVAFSGAPARLGEALAAMDSGPDGLLGLGVHGGDGFRLERRARAVLDSDKPDAEGRLGAQIAPLPEGDLESALDLERLCAALLDAGAGEAWISEDAGGYVCERTYHALLARGRRLGIPAVFLHVPPVGSLAVAEQFGIVRALVAEVAVSCCASADAPLAPPHPPKEH
ncbi:MAG: hypothetical protein QF903_05345 [Planctomycetota bacterium]|jgi:pyroglutamyl-peptidase|nr:hypothetical protein [Planctomycetota bacterium]MDP6761837.1 hypothetical protein [Planctomycetota bacterium]MDP6988883.1 hypothetical protein [Planctomycetota bacterium]